MRASSRAIARWRNSARVGATLHKVDERAPVEELRRLAGAYRAILEEVLA